MSSRILRAMADHLGGLATFSAEADVDNEVMDLQGQKLQLRSSVNLVVQRPGSGEKNETLSTAITEKGTILPSTLDALLVVQGLQ